MSPESKFDSLSFLRFLKILVNEIAYFVSALKTEYVENDERNLNILHSENIYFPAYVSSM
jgi:hypothetical protein